MEIKTLPNGKIITKNCSCSSCTVYTGCTKGFCSFPKHVTCSQTPLVTNQQNLENEDLRKLLSELLF